VSGLLSFSQGQFSEGLREDAAQSQTNVAHEYLSAPQVREMFDAGRIEEALREAQKLYEIRSKYFAQDAQTTVLALASLLEYATFSQTPLTSLHDHVRDLKKHWVTVDPSSEYQIADLVATELPFYMRYTLPRACEYAAHVGRKDPSLRDFAEQSLERLFWKYHEFPSDSEGLVMRESAAAAAIRAAAHIVTWKVQEERPDLRSLEYITKAFRNALEEFNAPKAELHYSFFQFAAKRYDEGLKTLENIVNSPQGVAIDERIAALDQLTGRYIRLKDFDNARASLASLQEAVEKDSTNEASNLSRNARVRAEEAKRLKWYEMTLADKGPRP
jgi:hypothetical protein